MFAHCFFVRAKCQADGKLPVVERLLLEIVQWNQSSIVKRFKDNPAGGARKTRQNT